MTLKIDRSADGDGVVFALSGRIDAERLAELQNLLELETNAQCTVLDLQGVDLVDRDAVRFLARCVVDGIQLAHCPGYVREWIAREMA
jgi:anti-anti-sigma regulatory factor